MSDLIKSHYELRTKVRGRRVLHMNSLGKDSQATLEWLSWAGAEVYSLNLSFIASHPKDAYYIKYLSNRYKNCHFIIEQDTQELNQIRKGIYQSPIDILTEFNTWEYKEFEFHKLVEEMRIKYNCDFICWGHSKYESVTRASGFYKRGLLQGKNIYPLGLLTKKQVREIFSTIKLHPCYSTSPSTYDFPSYYKMKKAFDKYPEYKEKMYSVFPLLKLDAFRYEVLLATKTK